MYVCMYGVSMCVCLYGIVDLEGGRYGWRGQRGYFGEPRMPH